jgi:hypothetical protein
MDGDAVAWALLPVAEQHADDLAFGDENVIADDLTTGWRTL